MALSSMRMRDGLDYGLVGAAGESAFTVHANQYADDRSSLLRGYGCTDWPVSAVIASEYSEPFC